MAPSPFSLILRHLSKNPKPHNYINHFLSPVVKQLSLSSHLQSDRIPNIVDSPKPSSLSARLGFIFDQIDQIEKERAEKDEALQRIKAWRESKNSRQQAENNVADSKRFENEQLSSGNSTAESKLGGNLIDPSLGGLKGEQEELTKKEVELVHPWPEWIEFMERLVQQNYFDHKRKDEDKMIEGLGFDMSEVAEEGFDFTRDWKTVQTAILNFGRDRFDILRSLSRHDIQVLVGYGCPSMDKKVVFSAKLLRKHVHLDEGDVCSSCSLRSSCEKAYLLTNKEDEARTIDVVRVLLTYGFDPISESVVNKSLLKQKSVKTVVRKLLHEVVKLSSVPIDPNLPPPLIKKRPPKVKQPPPPPKKRVGRDDIEMKKGDWLCPKCDFMNFAKNLDCLQCDAKRPKRQLLPGEWECPQCNFLNYRRNMACFHCEHKRPPDEYMENQAQERQRRPNARLDRVAGRQEVSNAWNFDFDDDESDGADVAAFEFADSHGSGAGNPSINQTENASLSGHEGDVCRTGTLSRAPENEYASFVKRKQHRVGFDDFSDEDDDGIDSYEIDNQPKNKRQEASSVRFSDVEGSSDSEGDDYFPRYHGRSSGRSSCSYDKPHIRPRGKGALSSSCGEDLDIDSTHDLPVHPKWKSSHVADSRPSKQMSFSSDEDLGLTSDSDDDLDGNFTGRKDKTGSREFGGRGFSRGGVLHEGHRRHHGSESSDLDLMSRGNRRVGNRISDRRSGFRGNNGMNFASSTGRRGNFGDDFGSPSQGSYGNGRGSLKGEYGGGKGNRRGRNLRDFNGPRRHGSGDRHLGRLNNFLDMGRDRSGERPRRRVNVR